MISFFPPEQVPGLPLTPGHFWTLSFSFLINQLKSLLDVLQFCFCFMFWWGFSTLRLVGSQLPDQESNLYSLHWKAMS